MESQTALAGALGLLGAGGARAGTSVIATIPAAVVSAPVDGRLILLISRDPTREPRAHVSPDAPLDSPYLFGVTLDGLTLQTW